MQTRPTVDLMKLKREDVAGRDVLVVDDIMESGETYLAVRAALVEFAPTSIRVAVCCDKLTPNYATRKARPDYTAFVVPDKWLYGYGMDDNGKLRHMSHIKLLDRPA